MLCSTRWGSAPHHQRAVSTSRLLRVTLSRCWSADHSRPPDVALRKPGGRPFTKRVNRARIFSSSFFSHVSTRFVPFSRVTQETTVCAEGQGGEKPKKRAERGCGASLSQVTPHTTRPPPPPARPRTPSRGSVTRRTWWRSSPSSWRRRARPRRPAPSSRRGTRKRCHPRACEVSGARIAPRCAPPRRARRASPAPHASSATPSTGSTSTVRPPRAPRRPRGHHPRAHPPRTLRRTVGSVFLAVPLFPTTGVRFAVPDSPNPGFVPFYSPPGFSSPELG